MKTIAIVGATPADSPVGNSAEAEAKSRSVSGEPTLNITHAIARKTRRAQGVALVILATVALIFALEWAERFVISLLLGIFFAYTLNPLVVWLEWIKVPRVVGTVLVLTTVVCGLLFGAYSLRSQAQGILDQLPAAASKISEGLAKLRNDPLSNMRKVQSAARQLETATSQTVAPTTHVIIEPSTFKLSNLLWAGSMGAVGFIGQATMVIFLTFFLLLSGDTFRRKLVRMTGPSLSKRKITVRILDEINASIQRYMFVLLLTNVLLGMLTWIAFRWIGLENPGAWATVAGLFHLIPYLGPVVTAAATGMAAYIQFDAFSMALLVAGVSLVIATVIGVFIMTWICGRMAKMNKAAVFVSLLFWGWLWGIPGMLLSIPIIVIVKVVSQHVEQLYPVAELLGE